MHLNPNSLIYLNAWKGQVSKMNNKDKITLLIGIIISLTSGFTSYFVYGVHSQLEKLDARIEKLDEKYHAEYLNVKEDYEYVLKNYPTRQEHDQDIRRLDDYLKGIKLYARKED